MRMPRQLQGNHTRREAKLQGGQGKAGIEDRHCSAWISEAWAKAQQAQRIRIVANSLPSVMPIYNYSSAILNNDNESRHN